MGKLGRKEKKMNLIIGLLIPFLGTTLGSAMVFIMKDKMNLKVENMVSFSIRLSILLN